MKKAIYGVAAGLALVTALACGTGTTTTGDGAATVGASGVSVAPSAAPKVYKLKEAVLVKEDFLGDKTEYVVTITSAKVFSKESGTYGSKPKNGEFLVLDVTVNVKVAGDTTYVSDSDFKFVAADGTLYGNSYAMGFGETLSAYELRAGQKSSGKVVFDLPKGAWKTGTLQYAASFMDADATCFWTLA